MQNKAMNTKKIHVRQSQSRSNVSKMAFLYEEYFQTSKYFKRVYISNEPYQSFGVRINNNRNKNTIKIITSLHEWWHVVINGFWTDDELRNRNCLI